MINEKCVCRHANTVEVNGQCTVEANTSYVAGGNKGYILECQSDLIINLDIKDSNSAYVGVGVFMDSSCHITNVIVKGTVTFYASNNL